MSAEITLNVERLVGGVITVYTGRNPAMTRLWWTTPRSGGMQSRSSGDYSDVAITGQLSQSSINNIDGHSRTSVVAVEIGTAVTSIGDNAFSDCSSLASVTIPDSVTSIGNYAFRNCYGLASVMIPNNVTSIGDLAFYNCTNLTSVTIPNSVIIIGDSAFMNCISLTSVSVENGMTSIRDSAFYGCDILQEMYFPGMGMDHVANNSLFWGIGINSVTGNTFMVTAYCADGIVVLNAKSGSSSGGSERDPKYTYVDYFNGRSEKYDISGMFYGYDNIYDIGDAQRIEFGNQVYNIYYNACINSPYLEYVKMP